MNSQLSEAEGPAGWRAMQAETEEGIPVELLEKSVFQLPRNTTHDPSCDWMGWGWVQGGQAEASGECSSKEKP